MSDTPDLKSHGTEQDTVADGETVSVSIPMRGGSEVTTLIDDGSGGTPSTYDLQLNTRPTADGEWMPFAPELTGETATSWTDTAIPGGYVQAVVTNQSGGSATFQVRLVASGNRED